MGYLVNWDYMFDGFKRDFPITAEGAVDWWPSGRKEITILLKDNSKVVYNYVGGTMRTLRWNGDTLNEEEWRKNFSARLKDIMRDRGISSQELSERTGISKQMLSRYMNAHTTPTSFTVCRLARVLECSENELTDICDVE